MKRGFTLIELLAVIIILSIIALITVFSVNSIISNSKDSLSSTQKTKIEEAAEVYYLEEGMSNNKMCVSVKELISKGYIESKAVFDPKDNKEMTGYIKISYKDNQYLYEYQEESCASVQ